MILSLIDRYMVWLKDLLCLDTSLYKLWYGLEYGGVSSDSSVRAIFSGHHGLAKFAVVL